MEHFTHRKYKFEVILDTLPYFSNFCDKAVDLMAKTFSIIGVLSGLPQDRRELIFSKEAVLLMTSLRIVCLSLHLMPFSPARRDIAIVTCFKCIMPITARIPNHLVHIHRLNTSSPNNNQFKLNLRFHNLRLDLPIILALLGVTPKHPGQFVLFPVILMTPIHLTQEFLNDHNLDDSFIVKGSFKQMSF